MNKEEIIAETQAFKKFVDAQKDNLTYSHYESWHKGWEAGRAYAKHRLLMNEEYPERHGCLYTVSAVIFGIILIIIFS
jgi:hypothetical protein